MEIYDRKLKKVYIENEYQKKTLDFLYTTTFGRLLLKYIVAKPFFSRLRGYYQKSFLSKKDIKPFIKKYGVDVHAFNLSDYKTFNDFFKRKKGLIIEGSENILISPADAKLSVYDITDDLRINVKKSNYSISEIVGDAWLSKQFKGGKCLIFRLSIDDYHRYIHIDSGKLKEVTRIAGELHTVRPISSEYNVFSRNTRVVSVLDMDNLGKIIQIEVGALLVGCIRNYNDKVFIKGEEKGYFEYGGSTIILLLNDNIKLDDDIIENLKEDREVKVSIGERIGLICSKD